MKVDNYFVDMAGKHRYWVNLEDGDEVVMLKFDSPQSDKVLHDRAKDAQKLRKEFKSKQHRIVDIDNNINALNKKKAEIEAEPDGTTNP